jgi:hypothetical protein
MGKYSLQEAEEDENDDKEDDGRCFPQEADTPVATRALVAPAIIGLSTTTSNENVIIEQHHYHIYHSLPPETEISNKKTCCRFVCSAWFLTLLALLSNTIYLYGPPAPPPSGTTLFTWREYLQRELGIVLETVNTWGHVLPAHVSYGCWQGLVEDTVTTFSVISKTIRGVRNNKNKCDAFPFAVLSTNKDHQLLQLQERFTSRIVSQDVAVEIVWRALVHWNDASNQSERCRYSKPLVLYLTGGAGVGKTHVAQVLADVFVSTACETTILSISCSNQYKDEQILYQQILAHVQSTTTTTTTTTKGGGNVGGSMVILERVQELRKGVFRKLMKRIRQHQQQQQQQQPDSASNENVFAKTLFVITSNVGNRILQKSIQKYSSRGNYNYIPTGELDAFLSYEIGLIHGTDDNNDNNNQEDDHGVDVDKDDTNVALVRTITPCST